MDIEVYNGNLFHTDAQFICHAVNCQGMMGSGVALQVHQKYPHVFYRYKKFCNEMKSQGRSPLGMCLIVAADPAEQNVSIRYRKGQSIVNLFTQNKYGREQRHTDYEAFKNSLLRLDTILKEEKMPNNTTIAMPYQIGCDRGGGDWSLVLPIISEYLKDYHVALYRKEE